MNYYINIHTKHLLWSLDQYNSKNVIHVGEFKERTDLINHLESRLNDITKLNDEIARDLGCELTNNVEMLIKYQANKTNKYLFWLFVHQFELSNQLTFQFRESKL